MNQTGGKVLANVCPVPEPGPVPHGSLSADQETGIPGEPGSGGRAPAHATAREAAVWRRFLDACRRSFRDPVNVDLWIEPCRLAAVDPTSLTIAAPSGVHGMVDRLLPQLTEIATRAAGRPMRVAVVIERQNGRAPAATRRPAASAPAQPTRAAGTET